MGFLYPIFRLSSIQGISKTTKWVTMNHGTPLYGKICTVLWSDQRLKLSSSVEHSMGIKIYIHTDKIYNGTFTISSPKLLCSYASSIKHLNFPSRSWSPWPLYAPFCSANKPNKNVSSQSSPASRRKYRTVGSDHVTSPIDQGSQEQNQFQRDMERGFTLSTYHDELEHTSSTRFFGYLEAHFCDSTN